MLFCAYKMIYTFLSIIRSMNRVWAKPGLDPDPLTSINVRYILEAWRIWSNIVNQGDSVRIPVVYTPHRVSTIAFNYPSGHNSLESAPDPAALKSYTLPQLAPISFLRWSQMPNVLGVHPQDKWTETLETLAEDIWEDCINVNVNLGKTILFQIDNYKHGFASLS